MIPPPLHTNQLGPSAEKAKQYKLDDKGAQLLRVEVLASTHCMKPAHQQHQPTTPPTLHLPLHTVAHLSSSPRHSLHTPNNQHLSSLKIERLKKAAKKDKGGVRNDNTSETAKKLGMGVLIVIAVSAVLYLIVRQVSTSYTPQQVAEAIATLTGV
jgi:hypothetical protein